MEKHIEEYDCDFDMLKGITHCSKCNRLVKYNENGYECACGWSEC